MVLHRRGVPSGDTVAPDEQKTMQSAKCNALPVWGEYVPHAHMSAKNICNGLVCLFALSPSIVLTMFLFGSCSSSETHEHVWDTMCHVTLKYPIAAVNALFFLNVTIGFWLIGIVQHSFWLIDPYWTIIPPLIGHFYQFHPSATPTPFRSSLSMVLIWLWAVRLTHSYFRREEWKFGQREDWRYTKMAKENPRSWWLLSFFAVGLAQQPMLCGITLPLYSINFSRSPFGFYDLVATALCLSGLIIAGFADNQLRDFMLENERRVQQGEEKVKILEKGLWKFSRHPNYFGEQLWWWGLALFSVYLGDYWTVCGTAFNSIVLAIVTVMTEKRILDNWTVERRSLYVQYRESTSVWIPLPRFGTKSGHLEKEAYQALPAE